ncbi:MAG: glycoside hydrolase family 16 protein [Verrucomicrobiota bacterium]|nr:glycoside hydrolase family 16 protein [Verrucomicrobiota bacterium]
MPAGLCLACFLASTIPSPAAPPGYVLQWSDDFTNQSLNLNCWSYAQTGWRRSAYNTPSAVAVTNGCLVISTYTAGGTNFTGFIDTAGKVLNSYGYYEAAIQFSNAPGNWSAFWLQSPFVGNTNNNPTNGVETDIFEHRCVDANGNSWLNGGDHALHWNGYGAAEQSRSWSSTNLGVGRGFHVYGLLWTSNRYTFYVDGRITWTTNDLVSSALQYIRLTSEVQSNGWAGAVPSGGYPNAANSPLKMFVDYVRYYAPPIPLELNRTAATGAVILSFSGESGKNYRVLAGTNLFLPRTNWTILAGGTFGPGWINYTDDSAVIPRKFYGIASP